MKREITIQLIFFVIIRLVINTMIRMVYPYLNVFASGLGVDVKSLTLGITIRSGVGILGPFLAILADRRGRKFGMILGMLLFVVGVSLVLIWPTLPVFILTLALTLLGNLVFIPSMQAYLGDRVAYQQRARALATTELSWSLSFIVGVPLVGFLLAQGSWKSPFALFLVLGILAVLLLGILIPKETQVKGSQKGAWQGLRLVFKNLPALAGLLMGAAMSSANELVNLTFGVWMETSFNIQIAALAVVALVIGISELAGEGLVGLFADRIGKARAVTIGLILNSLAALILPVIGRNAAGGVIGLGLFYLTFEFTLVSSIPLMTEVLPSARATLMASWIASISAGRAVGALLAPYLYAPGQTSGILFIVLVCGLFNLAAYLSLRKVKTAEALLLQNLPGSG